MLMCTHFAARGESSAVNVQLIGILNNMLVLSQVTMAGFMPPSVFAATAAMISMAVAINTGRLRGAVTPASPVLGSIPVWSLWQLFAGVCGLALIPQVMSNLLLPGLNLGVVPGAACALSLGAYFTYKMRSERSRSALRPVVGQLPGWAATLLFALSPLPQLVRNFMEPQSLEGLSLGTMLLALSGNALMLPRALFIQDPVWIAGTSWACLAGWGQLLSLRLGSVGGGWVLEEGSCREGAPPCSRLACCFTLIRLFHARTRRHTYLSAAPFLLLTALLVGYVVFVLTTNARFRTKTVESVWQELPKPDLQ